MELIDAISRSSTESTTVSFLTHSQNGEESEPLEEEGAPKQTRPGSLSALLTRWTTKRNTPPPTNCLDLTCHSMKPLGFGSLSFTVEIQLLLPNLLQKRPKWSHVPGPLVPCHCRQHLDISPPIWGMQTNCSFRMSKTYLWLEW